MRLHTHTHSNVVTLADGSMHSRIELFYETFSNLLTILLFYMSLRTYVRFTCLSEHSRSLLK